MKTSCLLLKHTALFSSPVCRLASLHAPQARGWRGPPVKQPAEGPEWRCTAATPATAAGGRPEGQRSAEPAVVRGQQQQRGARQWQRARRCCWAWARQVQWRRQEWPGCWSWQGRAWQGRGRPRLPRAVGAGRAAQQGQGGQQRRQQRRRGLGHATGIVRRAAVPAVHAGLVL